MANSVQSRTPASSRILVDLTPMLPGGANGGAKLFVLELLKHLPKIAKQSELILLCRNEAYDELASLECANVRRVIIENPATASKLKSSAVSVARALFKCLPENITRGVVRFALRIKTAFQRKYVKSVSHDLRGDLLFCPFTAPYFHVDGIPSICVVYDLQYKSYPEFFRPEERSLRDLAFVDACKNAAALVTISRFSHQAILKYGKIAPSKVHLIYLRLGQRLIPDMSIQDSGIFQSLHITPHRYLIYPANFWQHKNHERLISAFRIASSAGLDGDIKLVCTGSPGVRRDYLAGMAQEVGLGDRIIFPGYVSDEDLSALMRSSVGLIFPSLYEGFGMPLVEAMAAGVPIACSNSTSLPEVADDACLSFDPHEPTQIAMAIVNLVGNQTLRERLITNGLARAREFSDVEGMAREYWELFQLIQMEERKNDAD